MNTRRLSSFVGLSLSFLMGLTVFLVSAASAAGESAAAQPRPKRPAAGPEVTAVEVRPVKTRVNEPCPAKLSFLGEISTNGATKVEYTWESSDGRSWPVQTLKFASATVQSVTTTWQVGAPGKTVNAWILLKILSPNAKSSSKSLLDFKCAK